MKKFVQISKNKTNESWFIKSLYWFKSLSIIKHIFVFYIFITLIGSLLLWLPSSHKVDIKYVDALFTSASAFSDTGLVTTTTSLTWTNFGQAIIAMLILIGGLGWFALKVYFFNILLGRPMSFATREALASERGSSKLGATRSLVKVSITVMLILVVLFSVILSIYFYNVNVSASDGPIAHMNNDINNSTNGKNFKSLTDIPYHSWDTSIRFGIFHSISAINNAGFDIMGEGSVSAYYDHYGVQIIFILLFVTGGIGYPVIYDIYLWIKSRFTGDSHRWMLFTKISMATYTIIVALSLLMAFAIEVTAKDEPILVKSQIINPEYSKTFWNNSYYGDTGHKTMALIFNTMSTRNAGFATVDMHLLSSPTLWLYSVLMFIGSAPSSTAGGIRTTTIAITIMGIWARIRGRSKVRAFNRRIPTDTLTKSYVVLSVAVMLVIISTMIVSTSLASHGGELNGIYTDSAGKTKQLIASNGKPFTYTEILFEVSSAFGTTGLSTGITSSLSLAAKINLILIMFIGQLGVSASVLVWSNKNKSEDKHFTFVKEDVSIG